MADKKASWWSTLTPAQQAAHVERMKAGRAAKAKTRPVADSSTAQARVAAAVAEFPTHECYYECRPQGERVPRRIFTVEDPQWDELIKAGRDPFGSFIINELIRAKSGEVMDKINRTCLPEMPIPARSRMERFFATGEHVIRQKENERK